MLEVDAVNICPEVPCTKCFLQLLLPFSLLEYLVQPFTEVMDVKARRKEAGFLLPRLVF